MGSWIGQSYRRGILTSRFPAAPPSDEERPVTARAVRAADPRAYAANIDRCPVGAIAAPGVDAGRCIRCARCLAGGLLFVGPESPSRAERAALGPEPDPRPTSAEPAPLRGLGRSLHLYLIDVGSCDACTREVLALANPYYDASRLGIFFTNSPRHADVLLVVGVPTPEMTEPLRRTYDALPAPKAVVAVGVCPIGGGAFAGTPGLDRNLAELVPVDRFVPGCPPTPVAVLEALERLIGRPPAPEGG